MVKYSRQRECILKNLQGRRDHPTADMVYESVRMEQPNISLGTVYRNLALLAENGQILKISTGTGPDHFDGYTSPHVHFVCRHCGKVIDMEEIPAINLIDKTPAHFDGVIEGYELQIVGKCGDCLSIISQSLITQ
ncbi:MAG: transcriptional repressor [Lachnospiraceae bacterium]|nr:transcriptional repressor [Lachnospiraceae bacterium]